MVPKLGRERMDVLVALHATKSAASVKRAASRGNIRIVVALAGTDLYQDLPRLQRPWSSLELADRIVLLQPLGAEKLPPALRRNAIVIRQSVRKQKRPGFKTSSPRRFFEVLVVSNLRQVKDPLRAARAARALPPSSRIRVIHAGGALDKSWERRARDEMHRNPRYLWKGELSPAQTRRLLAHGDLLVLSSRSEGGANVLSEAIAAGVPVLASNIPGNVGLLGRSYPGLFEVWDTRHLARLMERAETDAAFYARLRQAVVRLQPWFDPAREREAWRRLLAGLV